MPTTDPRAAACACCGVFPGTEKFVDDGGALALVHGMYEMWCKGCVLRAQIQHIEDRIVSLAELKAELREWEASYGAT